MEYFQEGPVLPGATHPPHEGLPRVSPNSVLRPRPRVVSDDAEQLRSIDQRLQECDTTPNGALSRDLDNSHRQAGHSTAYIHDAITSGGLFGRIRGLFVFLFGFLRWSMSGSRFLAETMDLLAKEGVSLTGGVERLTPEAIRQSTALNAIFRNQDGQQTFEDFIRGIARRIRQQGVTTVSLEELLRYAEAS